MGDPTPFLLLHGPWRGPWWWEPVVSELAERGYPAEAPAMPGHCPEDDRSEITFAHYALTLEEILRSQPEPVVLVAHSAMTVVVQMVAPRVPQAVKALMFVQPLAVPDGRTILDILPPGSGPALERSARSRADLCVPVCTRRVAEQWMPGESPYDVSRLVEHLVPQPLGLLETPIWTRRFALLPVPRTVLYLSLDRSLPGSLVLRNSRYLDPRTMRSLPLGTEGPWLQPAMVATSLLSAMTADVER